MRLVAFLCALIGSAVLAATSVAAQPVTLSGAATIDTVGGRLAPTGLTPVGSDYAFSFSFDPAAAALFDSGDQYADYELPVTAFSASIGSFVFPLSTDPARLPILEIFSGFSFFGGSGSEPAIGFAFFLPGQSTIGGGAEPFAGAAGSSEQLEISGVFRAGVGDAQLTFASLIGRGTPFYQNFTYGTRDGRNAGFLSGDYAGGFSSGAGVPEPATWALMILGFGATGGALRRRRLAVPAAA